MEHRERCVLRCGYNCALCDVLPSLRLCQRINQQAVRDCKSDLIVFPLVDVDHGTGVLTASTASGGKKRKTTSSAAGPSTGQCCTVNGCLSLFVIQL